MSLTESQQIWPISVSSWIFHNLTWESSEPSVLLATSLSSGLNATVIMRSSWAVKLHSIVCRSTFQICIISCEKLARNLHLDYKLLLYCECHPWAHYIYLGLQYSRSLLDFHYLQWTYHLDSLLWICSKMQGLWRNPPTAHKIMGRNKPNKSIKVVNY